MKKRSALSLLLSYAGPFRLLMYLAWLLSALSSLVALLPFCYIWLILDELLKVAPHFSQATHLVACAWQAVAFAALALLLYYSALLCSHRSAFRIASNLRKALLRHLVTLPIGILEHYGSGQLRRSILTASSTTETYLAHSLPDMAALLVTPLGLFVLLFIFDWRFGLLCLAPLLLGFIILGLTMGQGTAKRLKAYQDALADMSNEAVEYVRGIPVVKTFGQSIDSFTRFKASIDRYEKWVTYHVKSQRLPFVLFMTVSNAIFALLIAAAIAFAKQGVTPELLRNLLFYILITPPITTNLMKILFMGEEEYLTRDVIQRMEQILAEKPLPAGTKALATAAPDIELRKLSYSYDGQKKALEDISLHIKAGEKVALVGPSGGGKSTLVKAIARFFDPQEGAVLVDGQDLREIEPSCWNRQVSYVRQESRLLKASILDNVRLGRPDATREEVQRALEAAQCQDILAKFPQGLDTVIGGDGHFVSGGEAQRLCIARALLKNAPVLLLDEATAFADPENESKIQAALSELSKDKTVILIAHRLSSVQNVDQVYVIDEGHVIEAGSPQDLLASGSVFAQMCQQYQQRAQWKLAKEAPHA